MKNILVLAVLVGLMSTSLQAQLDRSKRPTAGEERIINIGDPVVYKLTNGLTVILVEDHKVPKVSYNLTIDIPVFNESQIGGVGVASITGELLNSGTTTKSKDELDKSIDLLGATFNASSSGFYASSLKKHSDAILAIAADVLLNPSFPQNELERIKKTTKSGLESSKTDPGTIAHNVANVVNYGKSHPYGEVQKEEDVDKISLDHVKMYYNTFFKPNISYLVVVGDITEAELKTKVEKAFGSWKEGKIPNIPIVPVVMPTESRVCFSPKKGAVQSEIRITFPVNIKPGSTDEMAAKLMNSVLGGGVFSGRLMVNLREDKAFTYGCRSSLSSDEEVGEFKTNGSFRNAVTDSAITEILAEVNGMVANEITDREILLAKQGMKGGFIRGLESPATIAYLALRRIKYNLPADYYKTYLQRLDKISKEDLKAMAKKYLRPESANIVVVGNEDIADKLKQFDAKGKIIKMDYKGDIIKDIQPIPEGVVAINVVNDYLTFRFGTSTTKALLKIRKKAKTVVLEYEMTIPQAPQPLTVKTYNEAPNKYIRMTTMGTMALNKDYFDGTEGGNYGMQAKKAYSEKEVAEKKATNVIYPHIDLVNPELYTIELNGIEEVNEKPAYKMTATSKSGSVEVYYFGVESKVMVRFEQEDGEGSDKTFVQTTFLEWKDYEGVQFQSKVEMNVSSMTLMQTLIKVEVNAKVDQNLYGH